MSKLQSIRARAFLAQSGRCYYCRCPIWLSQQAEFAQRHGITPAEAARFRCTAEHLVAASDGGAISARNIAAACAFCNSGRHRRANPHSPERHQAFVRHRLAQGRWHPKQRFAALLAAMSIDTSHLQRA